MTFVSYAQNFEDVILWRALHDVKPGRYLDIGAQDPVVDSVSLAFYEAGWKGVHVEATPFYAARLKEARPDEIVIEAAVTDHRGPIQFFEIPNTGLSTGKKELAKVHDSAGYAYHEIVVQCIRLDELLESVEGDIHWLKIDVEGMEANVLRSWGESACRPWVLLIESTTPNTQERTEGQWIEEVLRRGYQQVFFDGLSCYFLHEDHRERASRFEAPANVFDGFSIANHHFSAAKLRQELEALEGRVAAESANADQLRAQIGDAWKAYEGARQEQRDTLERLVGSEQDHRSTLEAQIHERNESEKQRREGESKLRQAVSEAEDAAATARAEVARLKERSAQLGERLNQAETLSLKTEERLLDTERKAEDLRTELELALSKAQDEATEARAAMAGSEQELAKTGAAIAAAEQDCARLRAAIAVSEQERANALSKAERLADGVRRLREAMTAQQEAAGGLSTKLNDEIARLRAMLAGADALIAKVAEERPGTWQRIGESLKLTLPSPCREAASSWLRSSTHLAQAATAANSTPTQAKEYVMPSLASPQSRNPYFRANSLAELLAWHDADFVRCAYVTILGRQPDPAGEAHYIGRMRRGESKLKILHQLRQSPEGPKHDPGIRGLDRTLERAVLQSWPLIGWLFRLIWPSEDSVAPQERQFRAIMNALEINKAATQLIAGQMQSSAPAPAPAISADTQHGQILVQSSASTSRPAHRIVPELAHRRLRGPLTRHFARKTH